jgi:HAMP domain-containing protein
MIANPYRVFRQLSRPRIALPTGLTSTLGSVGQWLSEWPRARIARKIIIPYAFLALVLGAIVTYLATQMVTGNLTERFDNQLVQASRSAADAVARNEVEHLEMVRAVAFTRGLPEATLAKDSAAIGELVSGQLANSSLERLEVLSADGQRLKSLERAPGDAIAYREIADADKPAEWPIVRAVLADTGEDLGRKHSGIVTTASGAYLLAATPIVVDGAVAGVVLAGTSVPTLLREAKSQAMVDVTLYDLDGGVLGTTMTPESTGDAPGLALDAENAGTLGSSDAVLRDHTRVSGRDYDFAISGLRLNSEVIALYSVALPSDFIFTAASTTRWQLGLIFGLGMAAVLGIGFFLSRSVTRPLQALASTADAVSQGDFTARTTVSSIDESSQLARSINRMTDRLEGQYLGTLRVLASAVVAKDSVTLGHSIRVGQLAARIGRELGLDERTISYLEVGGYLHDVGGIGIRSAKLRDDVMSADEHALVEGHPHLELTVVEASIAEKLREVPNTDDLFGDPTPQGNSLNAVVSRIVSVADMFDALTRPPRPHQSLSIDDALRVVRDQAGVALHFGTVEKLAQILSHSESGYR